MKKSFTFFLIFLILPQLLVVPVKGAGAPDQMDWVNLQWPPRANIPEGGSFNIYTRCNESGITEPAGADPRVSVWIGYNTENTNPNTWNTWIPATFNNQFGTADEYVISLGGGLNTGIYYYASRIQLNEGNYQYGGYNAGGGDFWDGTTNVSGILAVGKALATVILGNTLQLYDGSTKQVIINTDPAGLTVQVTYDGSSDLPVNPGTYKVLATISDPGYQGSQAAELCIYEVPRDAASAELRNKQIWVKYDQVLSQYDLDEAMSYNPDVISRGWFKWGSASDYGQWSWMIDQSAAQQIVFGGGGTVQALYPDEVDEAKLLRMVERTPLNKPMYFAGDSAFGFYNGDFQNEEYQQYLLDWMYKQIDAGASTLHLDGIAAAPATNTGYSDFSMGEFNTFIIRKYCEGHGWTVDDSRWQTVFNISLSLDCIDGTINTFDYRKFLVRNGYEKDPMQFNFGLRKEFGDPWNYAGTYSDERNQKACEILYSSLKSYAETKGRQVTVTTNGYSKYVDYQTMGVWDSWWVEGGRLNISPSYVQHWRDIKEFSMRNTGRDIPLIVFHDWGFGMPFFDEIPPEDQILWLRVYAPEVFASGAVFAWPVSGGGNLYKPAKAVLDTVRSLVKWYDYNRSLYINSSWNGDSIVNMNGLAGVVKTVSEQYSPQQEIHRRIVHLINKNTDGYGNLVPESNFTIQARSSLQPLSVWAASPDFTGYQRLDFTFTEDGVNVNVKTLQAYTVVVLDYQSEEIPTGIPHHTEGELQIWPNPCLDVLNINNISLGSREVHVLDMYGRTCLSGIIANEELDVKSLQPGMYILKAGNSVCRFIKQ